MERTPRLIATALLATVLAGCAGTAQKESTGEYIDDSAITSKVKAAFVKDPKVDALDIKVETFKGKVQLSGFADNRAEADRAAELARSVDGVKGVRNDIRVKGQ